jgi:hypothetical protein
MGVSLDGHIVGPDGDFDWTVPERLRAEPGEGHIAIGGATLAAEAAALGLIDEYRASEPSIKHGPVPQSSAAPADHSRMSGGGSYASTSLKSPIALRTSSAMTFSSADESSVMA